MLSLAHVILFAATGEYPPVTCYGVWFQVTKPFRLPLPLLALAQSSSSESTFSIQTSPPTPTSSISSASGSAAASGSSASASASASASSSTSTFPQQCGSQCGNISLALTVSLDHGVGQGQRDLLYAVPQTDNILRKLTRRRSNVTSEAHSTRAAFAPSAWRVAT
jgi:hypothetical protein